jgi:hypothetical protein
LATHATKGTRQSSTSTSLEQDQANQKHPDQHVDGQQKISQIQHIKSFLLAS